jgi:hypothetical protein
MTLSVFARIGLLLLIVLPIAAQAEEEGNPLRPDRNPLRAEAKSSEELALPGEVPTVAWTDAEVTKAKADCAKILTGLALDYEALPPVKEGKCGAPAPIRLKPSPVAVPPLPARPPDRTSEFVRKVHAEACKIFGTVLGPNSNGAHEDHFHLDMKARRRTAFCE